MRRIALLWFLLPFVSHAQSFERNEFTFTGGYAWQFSVPSGAQRDTAVSLGGTYSFRFRRWLAFEGGILTAIDPTGVVGSYAGFFDIHDRYTWVPFGVRFIVPVHHDRIELSAGGGGVYERYTVGNTHAPNSPSPYSGAGGYFKGEAALALDRGRHFWLGVTPQWMLANGPNGQRDRWFALTGNLGFRF